MSNNKQQAKTQQIITETGELHWVSITGKGRENQKGNMEYTATVKLPNNSDDLKKLTTAINDFWDANKPQGSNDYRSCGIKEEKDDKQQATGFSLVTFKTPSIYPDGNLKDIQVVDGEAKSFELDGFSIGNGSLGRVEGSIAIYNNSGNVGVSLYLNSVQVTELIKFEHTRQSAFTPVK